MTYAVVQTGGKQYRVEAGKTLVIEKLPGVTEAGAKVELDQVLLIGGEGETVVGTPTVAGAVIRATVANADAKGKKLIVFKYKSKVRYRKKTGHRQHYTELVVDEIARA
jgi:large subunit ribosomal protein L21